MMMSRFLCMFTVLSALALGQSFSSGSNGSDGALNLTTPGTVVFDPAAMQLDPAGDNVFNFTTINIGAGVTVKLLNGPLRGKPVVWLSTGSVTVAGTIELTGMPGSAINDQIQGDRRPADPGPGGYPGGLGIGFGSAQTDGFGPGHGLQGPPIGATYSGSASGAGYGTAGTGAQNVAGGSVYGNVILVPLRGGSGGGGAGPGISVPPGTIGGGGGGGGGALRIESSSSITVNGSILADGGAGGSGGASDISFGGGGSGGGIHLIAPSITGTGVLSAKGGGGTNVPQGGAGRIRLDAFTEGFTGTTTPTASLGAPYAVPLPTAQPMLRVTSVGGVSVPPNPTGSFVTPDVALNTSNAVTVNIQASNVPLGTIVTLYLFSEVATDQTVQSTPLVGTFSSSTATAQAAFQPGYSRGFVRATF